MLRYWPYIMRHFLALFYFIVLIISLYYFFFFSSRRRHTRWTGDWSSDVCSSDLLDKKSDQPPGVVSRRRHQRLCSFLQHSPLSGDARLGRSPILAFLRPWRCYDRSEERRVGKECRSRWEQCH